jgi:hypothetical protein
MEWYNSGFAKGTVVGTAILGGLGLFIYAGIKQEEITLQKELAKSGYVMQVADLNDNGIQDKFYIINNQVAVVELDGKPVYTRR